MDEKLAACGKRSLETPDDVVKILLPIKCFCGTGKKQRLFPNGIWLPINLYCSILTA
jgi:hypothetical protein